MADSFQLETPEKGSSWKRWLLAAVALILAIFIALNSQKVEINFIVGKTEVPLIVGLLIAGLLGSVIGWAAPKLRRDSKRERKREEEE